MHATSGFSAASCTSSWWIRSLARALPPGESTCRTTPANAGMGTREAYRRDDPVVDRHGRQGKPVATRDGAMNADDGDDAARAERRGAQGRTCLR